MKTAFSVAIFLSSKENHLKNHECGLSKLFLPLNNLEKSLNKCLPCFP
jgi:hypothetical protein